jgi:ATP-dependent DNA helicase RecG
MPGARGARGSKAVARDTTGAKIAPGAPDLPPALVSHLARLGIHALADALLHLPLRYEDETRLVPLARAQGGAPVQFEATVASCEVRYRPRRQLVARVIDEGAEAELRFFTFYPSLQKSMVPGVRVRVFGELRPGLYGAELVHPRVRVLRGEEPLPEALTPVYPTVAGVSQIVLRRLARQALARADLTDTLPASWIERLALPDFESAVRLLHAPPPGADAQALMERTHPAWRRIKFDELLAQQISMRRHKSARRARTAPMLASRGELTARLLASLPFALTGAQARVWAGIEAEIAQAHPMNRLLQGDVGSGKTIVAALAALRAVESGCQAVIMAPTEILAEQHARKFGEWLSPLGVGIEWVAGAQKKRERAAALARLASGESAVAVGTHALFQGEVAFRNLGIAIVDEQHRFGVRQRLALRAKGQATVAEGAEAEPHLLMMSATPIPRTLAMSHYADLDVSVIDELPPGRTPVRTRVVSSARRDEVIEHVRAACAAGGQVYWVCPLIEESETLDLRTATETAEALSQILTGLRVGLLHGRLPAEEKAAIVAGFSAREIDILVATTVVEVGVDVPNASLMVIEHAERFGLAQIHQLRGRVGRGAAVSTCILLYQGPLSQTARARLRIVYENTDGFRIAEEDLRLRGPGELMGVRQSGVPLLRFADLALDEDLLDLACKAAERLIERDPVRAQAHVARWTPDAGALLKA